MEAAALAVKSKNAVAARRLRGGASRPRSAQAFAFWGQAKADSPAAGQGGPEGGPADTPK